MLNYSPRDKNERTHRSGEGGGGRRARYVTPDLSYCREGVREWREDNEGDEEK